jgi:2-oxoglutarate dehydrogenase complex dehydrogenase (E1) component-like enzyme
MTDWVTIRVSEVVVVLPRRDNGSTNVEPGSRIHRRLQRGSTDAGGVYAQTGSQEGRC